MFINFLVPFLLGWCAECNRANKRCVYSENQSSTWAGILHKIEWNYIKFNDFFSYFVKPTRFSPAAAKNVCVHGSACVRMCICVHGMLLACQYNMAEKGDPYSPKRGSWWVPGIVISTWQSWKVVEGCCWVYTYYSSQLLTSRIVLLQKFPTLKAEMVLSISQCGKLSSPDPPLPG